MAGATRKRRALQHWLLVWWEKSISNEYPARTYSETIVHLLPVNFFLLYTTFRPRNLGNDSLLCWWSKSQIVCETCLSCFRSVFELSRVWKLIHDHNNAIMEIMLRSDKSSWIAFHWTCSGDWHYHQGSRLVLCSDIRRVETLQPEPE